MSKIVLVTGGAGYIGSHTVLELLNTGYNVVVMDNLSNSKVEALKRVQDITGRALSFIQADIRDLNALRTVMYNYPISAVIHFAGLKSVSDSISKPRQYYDNNIGSTLSLLEVMEEVGVRNLVFSSSATVYGDPHTVPIKEDFPLSATNPYGASKLMIENILRDVYKADNSWNIALLRYFNPTGAHASGRIGEDPNGTPNNLMPYIAQVASAKLARLRIFGDNYATPDGTGVRDYIHVVDLALGHIKALQKLDDNAGLLTVNLGTGKGYSVLEMLTAFERVTGKSLPYELVERRAGDVAACYADPAHAKQVLGWQAERDQEAMCADMWRWQSKNPEGYTETPVQHLPVHGGV